MAKHVIAEAKNLKAGERVITTVNGIKIAVFNIDGSFSALANYCPDQGGPVCQGNLFDRVEAEVTADGEIREFIATRQDVIACPWHGWEFDVRTGKCLWNDKFRIRSYKVELDADGEVSVLL